MKTLVLLLRLLLMCGMFVGIFLLIRWPSLWLGFAGIGLILSTPVLNALTVRWSNRKRTPGKSEVLEAIRIYVPLLLPAVVFTGFVIFTPYLLDYSRHLWETRFERPFGEVWLLFVLLIYLLFGLPVITVLKDAMNGSIDWSLAELSGAYRRSFVGLCAIVLLALVSVLGAVLPIGVGVFGTILLLITLGDLGWQWLDSGPRYLPIQPFFCREYGLGRGWECGVKLGGLHALQVLATYAMIMHGARVADWAAGLIARLKDYAESGSEKA